MACLIPVVDFANENILQQQAVMSNKIAQLEAAAEGRVQREAAAAKLVQASAEQKMSQENKNEVGLVLDLYSKGIALRKKLFIKKRLSASNNRGGNTSVFNHYRRRSSRSLVTNALPLHLALPPSRRLTEFENKRRRRS